MIALRLTDLKGFMNELLRTDTFDHFLLQEAVIVSAATYVIDGHITKDFYSAQELEELGLSGYSVLPFSFLRGSCFDLIKGKKTPASFRFVFELSPENLRRTLESVHSSYTVSDLSGVFINLKFQNQMLTLTTGISYRIFSADKSLDAEWDTLVKKFLTRHQIAFEEL
jgi:hypothetical protein